MSVGFIIIIKRETYFNYVTMYIIIRHCRKTIKVNYGNRGIFKLLTNTVKHK